MTLLNALKLLLVGSIFISPVTTLTPDTSRPLFTQPDHTLELLKFPTHTLPINLEPHVLGKC